VNEVQTVTMVRENIDVTGGAFVLNVTNAGIPIGVPFAPYVVPYNATAAQIQFAAEEFVGAGNVVCAGGPINVAPVTLTFVGALAETNVALSTWSQNPDLQNRLQFTYTITTPKGWLTKTAEKRTCQTLTAAENRSVYWGGSLSEPDHASPCRPPAIMWWMDAGHDIYLGYNNRSASSPLFARRKTASMFGMLSPEQQAESLDSVSIEGVEAIETTGFYPSGSGVTGFDGHIVPQNSSKLTTWLGQGDKKLFLSTLSRMNFLPAVESFVTTGELLHPFLYIAPVTFPDYAEPRTFLAVPEVPYRAQIQISEGNPYDLRDRSVPLWDSVLHIRGLVTYDSAQLGVSVTELHGFRFFEAENFDVPLYDLVFFYIDGSEMARYTIAAASYVGQSAVLRANVCFDAGIDGEGFNYTSRLYGNYFLYFFRREVYGFPALQLLLTLKPGSGNILETLYEGVLS
jgi:hypothetical protein